MFFIIRPNCENIINISFLQFGNKYTIGQGLLLKTFHENIDKTGERALLLHSFVRKRCPSIENTCLKGKVLVGLRFHPQISEYIHAGLYHREVFARLTTSKLIKTSFGQRWRSLISWMKDEELIT